MERCNSLKRHRKETKPLSPIHILLSIVTHQRPSLYLLWQQFWSFFFSIFVLISPLFSSLFPSSFLVFYISQESTVFSTGTAPTFFYEWLRWTDSGTEWNGPCTKLYSHLGKAGEGGGFKSTAIRIYGRWGDGKIKHQKGWLLNLIPSAIFIVVAIGCADRALKKRPLCSNYSCTLY